MILRVIDTSAWIEYLLGTPTGRMLAHDMPDREFTLVPTIVQMELYKWLAREMSVEVAELALADTKQGAIAPLTTELAISAAGFAAEYKLSAADAIIYATAQQHGADVLTCDAHFEGLPGVIYISKS